MENYIAGEGAGGRRYGDEATGGPRGNGCLDISVRDNGEVRWTSVDQDGGRSSEALSENAAALADFAKTAY